MPVITAALAELAISAGPPVANDAVSFALLSYTPVAQVVDLGTSAVTAADVGHTPLETRVVQSFKGSLDYGTRAILLGKDLSDAGQIILVAGADGAAIDTIHSVRVTLSDGSIEFQQARIMIFDRTIGTIDSIVGASVTFRNINALIDA